MKRNLILLIGFITFLGFTSCQKEYSAETTDTPATGSLQSDITSECLPKTIGGTFVAGKTLNDSNYIDVQINVTNPGVYSIVTDTLNGYAFKGSGFFNDAGLKTVRLLGSGTPLSAGNNLFVVSFDTSFCLVQVVVLPAGAGGPANFTLQGSGSTCLNYSVAGNYVTNEALTASNTVNIGVNVTTIGTYSVTTTAVNGITFSGTGTLSNTGPQTIVLTASGTPLAEETSTFTVSAGGATCTFDVVVTATAVAGDYYPRTANSNWTYAFDGDVNDTLFRAAVSETITALGNTWNIFGESTDLSQGLDSSGYYRKAGNDYFEYLDFGAFFGFENAVWGQYIMLKDNQPVAGTWTSEPIIGTQGGVSFTLRIKSTILQKDASITVLGTAYPNTIVVEEKIEADAGGGNWTDITAAAGYIRTYYSKNIGMIKKEFFNGAGTSELLLELKRHQVF